MKVKLYSTLLLQIFFFFETNAQIFSPEIFQYEEVAAGPSTDDMPFLFIQLNGAFREISETPTEASDKLNGSVLATIFKKGKWSTTIGYTLNKIKENSITTSENYFSSIMTPDFGGQSITVEGNYFFSQKGNFGLYGNFGLGLDNWIIDNTNYKSSPGQYKLMATFHPLKNMELSEENYFNLIFRAGISGRFLTSDLSSKKDLLMDKFNTSKTSFLGPEVNINLLFNDLNLYFSPLWLFNNQNIEGFPTNGLYTIGLIVTGDFLKFQFKKIENN